MNSRLPLRQHTRAATGPPDNNIQRTKEEKEQNAMSAASQSSDLQPAGRYPAKCTGIKYAGIGELSMPANFRYAEIFRRGRPRHGKPGILSTYDAFYIKHPPMSTLHRAKLFAPFDALAGFGGRIAAKEVLYKERKILTEEEKEELDRRLAVIHRLAPDTRTAQKNRLRIEVTYFSPCEDPESESFGSGRGQYRTAAGIVRKVDTLKRRILVGDQNIDLDTVTALSGNPLLEQIFPDETA